MVRDESNAHVKKMVANIEEQGYDPDSSLLIFQYFKKGMLGKGKLKQQDTIDGNTRLKAAKRFKSIKKLPCRVIQFEEGKSGVLS